MTAEERRVYLLAPIKVGWLGRNIVSGQGGWAGCASGVVPQLWDDEWDSLNSQYGRVGRQARVKPQGE